MTLRPGPLVSRCGALVAAALWWLAATSAAWPQAMQKSAPQPAPPPALGVQQPAPPPAQPAPPDQPVPEATPENPGLIHEMGKLIDKIVPSIKGPSDTIKDAGDTLSKLKPGTMVSGRTICPPAADRTPDCQVAANFLCQGKGYKEGKSLNTDSAESCSAKVLIPGRQRKPDDCKTSTYVTTALCQ